MKRLLVPALALLLLGTATAVLASGAAAAKPSKAATTTILSGVFTNSAKYTGTGSVSVTRRAGVRTVRLAKDFRADPGAIRLRLYLATDASGRTFADLGPMTETGIQSFRVPKNLDLSRYRYVIAWCAAVSEPITQAKLTPPRR